MALSEDVAYLLRRAIPDALDPLIRRAAGGALPRLGEGGRYRVLHTGHFSSHVAADLLAFGRNQRMNGALIVVDSDVVRTLYYKGGRIAGADSDVIFERLGRVLHRNGIVDEASSHAMVAAEEEHGLAEAASMVPRETARWGLERRVWEIVAALFFMNAGNFLIVEGAPDLGRVEALDLSPMDLALEGLRRYDEWRSGTHGVPLPQRPSPETRPPEVPTAMAKPTAKAQSSAAADDFLDELRKST